VRVRADETAFGSDFTQSSPFVEGERRIFEPRNRILRSTIKNRRRFKFGVPRPSALLFLKAAHGSAALPKIHRNTFSFQCFPTHDMKNSFFFDLAVFGALIARMAHAATNFEPLAAKGTKMSSPVDLQTGPSFATGDDKSFRPFPSVLN